MSIPKRLLSCCCTLLFALFACPISAAEECSPTPEATAEAFVMLGIEDPRRATELVKPSGLKLFRSRLQQITDHRYSPLSARYRVRLLGADWTPERLSTSSDKEVVGQFFARSAQQRRDLRISDFRIDGSKPGSFDSLTIFASYRVEAPTGTSVLKREFSAYQVGNCWVLDVPVDLWISLEEISKFLKIVREQTGIPRQGNPRVTLQLAAASESERPGMKLFPRRGTGPSVWVAVTSLLTGKDVVNAYAEWDCEPSQLGPEESAVWLIFSPKAEKALLRWSELNLGSMYAVVVDGRVALASRVAAVLSAKVRLCLRGESLEEAQALAIDLMGARQ